MEEVLPGVHRWTAKHPNHGLEVSCHHVAGSRTAIDPLIPAQGIGWFDDVGVDRVVLSTRHHLRHAEQVAERFDCPILCHRSGLYEFENGPAVTGFDFGDPVADDVTALEMDSISPDDTVLRIDAGGGALLFADAVIHYGEVGFVPDHLIGEEPQAVKDAVRERCRSFLEEEFEVLLFAHGTPLADGAREALAAFAGGG
jgi:glyoxylase-like metal-dependent hydrolase (beta-lactamase superfamily II)